MASYKALYRKWRPAVFSDVIGQEHITDVLRSEVMAKTVSHAYLFCGSRGTGKTTCAKILAKAVSCDSPVNGDPCGKCPSCLAAEHSLDIYEIDAASYNGVDNIRELRDTVAYPPSELKRRVYIIDEVHMLSTGAFNALLKTLEEPPEHVLFILATTELQKIPATILSRCKRFDFHRITAEKIAERLRLISDAENIPITDRALSLIARLAAGAMRDALSMLELFCMSENTVDIDEASERLGVVGRKTVFSLTDAILSGDTSRALSIIAEAYDNSKDLGVLCGELSDTLRDIMIVKYARDPARLIDASDADLATLSSFATRMRDEKLNLAARACEEMQGKLSRAVFSRRAVFETGIIRLCEEKLYSGTDALLSRIAALEDAVSRLSLGLPTQSAGAPAAKASPEVIANGDTGKSDSRTDAPSPVGQEEAFAPSLPDEAPPFSDADVPPERDAPFDGGVETPARKTPAPPKPLSAAFTADTPADGEEIDCFAEFVEETAQSDKMAASMLEGGKAYVNEQKDVEIRAANPVAPMLLSREDKLSVLTEAIAKTLGFAPRNIKVTFSKPDKAPERTDLASLL